MPILPDNSVEYTEEAEAITSENMTDGSSVTENNATYNDPFDYNGPADIGVPDPLPVVPVVPEEEDEYYYVTYYNRGDLTEYEPAYLQELAEAGCKFYAIYDDDTEVEIQWTEIEDLDPLETEIDISTSIAAASNQHFWDDTNGVHVAEVAKEDWQTALEAEFSDLSSSKNYYNILMNSLGLLLRRANFILTSINRASISFYDGLGNETTNIMASFGRNSAQIGRSNDKHVVINSSGLTAYNSDGTLAPLTGTFDGANINNSSITNAKIVDGTIEGTKIASATIDNSNIKNGTIEGTKIASATIDNSNIKNGTIEGTKIASATIDNSNIKNGTITGTKIASATIDNSNIKNGTITGAKIADGTIENTDIKNGTITGAKIASATIENSNIKDGTIQGSKIIGSTLTDIPYAGISDADVEVARVANAEIAKAEVNYAHITNGVIDNAKINHADVNGLSANYATVANLNAATARIGVLEAADVTIDGRLDAAEADIDDLKAEDARIGNLVAQKASITDLNAATARIGSLEAADVTIDGRLDAAEADIDDLEADHVSVEDFEAEQANIDTLQANTADIATIRANSAKVQNLTAAQLEADHATVGSLSTTYATITNLNAATGRISDLESTRVRTTDLEANYITADTIEANYTKTDLSNTDVAWIQNGTIKDGAISNAMIGSLSASKLTAGTINGNTITVTNLNADNITAGTLNGQRIGEGSLSLSKLEEDVYTESEVDSIVSNLQTQIDGAIETWTGTAVPTLNNSPASGWTTNAIKDTHVGDVYFVVNSNSQQNGYNYRFTKSGSTYSWQLIKDSDVTNALQRLTTAEGKIGTIEQFDSDISSWKTDTDEELASIKSAATTLAGRVTTAEGQIATKVETSTFNTLSQTVNENVSSIQSLTNETTTITQKITSEVPYSRVEWVESIGKQLLTIDWKPGVNGAFGFDADFIIYNGINNSSWATISDSRSVAETKASCLFGIRQTGDIIYWQPQYAQYMLATSAKYGAGGSLMTGGDKCNAKLYTDKRRQQCSLRNGVYTAPDGSQTTLSQTEYGIGNSTMQLFGLFTNSGTASYTTTTCAIARVYSLKFYDDSDLAVDLVPVVRNRDNMPGLYDNVKQKFYALSTGVSGPYVGPFGESEDIKTIVSKDNPVLMDMRTTATRLAIVKSNSIDKLEDGQRITVQFKYGTATETFEAAGITNPYYSPASSNSQYLRLIFSDGTYCDHIIWYSPTTSLTTQYGAGSQVTLVYHNNVFYGSGISLGGWYCDANYDTNSNTVTDKIAVSVVAGLSGIFPYSLVMRDQNDNWTSLTTTGGTSTSKARYTGGLKWDNIAYSSPNATYAAGSNTGDGLFNSYNIDIRYSTNVANNANSGLIARQPLYLVGEVHSDGLFYLDNPWWTQTEPTTEDGKTYIFVGMPSSYYMTWLVGDNVAYRYIDGEFAPFYTTTITKSVNRINEVTDTVSEHTRKIGLLETSVESKADGSTVETMSTKLNTVSDTVDGHTQSISSITSTQTTMQGKLDKTLVETTQLWFSKANTTAPNKPTVQVTSTSTEGNAWRVVVPAYNASYPNYYYCYQWKYSDGTYGWSSVTRDIAMGESQERARTAITNAAAADTKAGNAASAAATAQSTADTANTNASAAVSTANTANTNASTALSTANTAASDASDAKTDAAAAVSTANTASSNASTALSTANTASSNASTAVSTANTAKSTADTAKATADKNIKSTTQLWYTKANETAPAKPTTKVTSTAVSGNGWRVVVPTYASDYPYYFYCYQYELADGTCTWSNVVYDRATTENQANSRSAVTGVSTLTTKTNNIQDTVDGHTQSLQSVTQTQTTIQQNAVKSTVQLWFTKADTTAPNKPNAHVTTNNAATGNAWNLAVPTYNASYPNYYYCYEYQYLDGSYGWSAVTRDIATGEMQEQARTAITNAANAQADIDNLEIGGRNLLEGTSSEWTEVSLSTSQYYLEVHTDYILEIGQTYTFSIIVEKVSSDDVHIHLVIGNGNRGSYSHSIVSWNKYHIPFGEVVSITHTITEADLARSSSDTTIAPYFSYRLRNEKNATTIRYKNVKLEKGNRATDWTPAPEDVDADISTAQTSADNAQATADKNVKESVQLWFTKANGSAPDKPTSAVTSTATSGNAWTTKVPTYSASYPHYFYCMQYKFADDTYTWSDVVYDQATTEAQSVARTTSTNLSTLQQDYATFKQTTQNFESTIGTTYATKTEVSAVDDKIDNLEIPGTKNWYANWPRSVSMVELGYLSNKKYIQTNCIQDFSKNFCMRSDFIRSSDYTTQRYCLASSYGILNENESSQPMIGVEIQANSGKVRLYSKSDTGSITDTIVGTAPDTGVVSTIVLWWNSEESTVTWLLISGDRSETGFYKPSGTFTGKSGYIRLGADSRADNTWNVKYYQRDIPPIWYSEPPESIDNLCKWFCIEKGDGTIAGVSSVECASSPKYKYVTSAYKDTLPQSYNRWLQWGQEGATLSNFILSSAAERDKLNIGDLACCEGLNITDNKPIYIVIEVTSFYGTTGINGISHGLIDPEIRSTVNAIESRVSSAETSITQTNQQIALKANASDVYTKTQTDGLISTEVENRNSAIEQSAAAINLSVSETYATKEDSPRDNILRGTNVLGTFSDVYSDTNATWSNGMWSRNSGTSASGSASVFKISDPPSPEQKYGFRITCINSNNHDFGQKSIGVALIAGIDYTISGWVRIASDSANSTPKMQIRLYPQKMYSKTLSTEIQWTYFTYTFSLTQSQIDGGLTFLAGVSGSGSIEYCGLKLEKGSDSTSWCYSSQDSINYVNIAKSDIKITTDGITSTVEKINSAKYLVSGYAAGTSLANIRSYASNQTLNFMVESTEDARVGDTVYLRYKDTTRNCYVYIKGTVSSINSATSITLNTHGYEDIIPVDTIKSTINQSSDSVKIQARHVEIDGAAIFSNTAFKAAADAAYDAKGSASAVQNNLDNLEIGGRNLLPMSQFRVVEQGPDTLEDSGWISDSSSSGDGRLWSYAKSNWQVYLAAGTYILSWETSVVTTSSTSDMQLLKEDSTLIKAFGRNAFTTIGKETYSFTINSDRYIGLMFKLYAGKARFKLEKGNKATDWTPAPEDVDAAIDAAVDEEQYIYRSAASGTTSMAQYTTWVTANGDTQNAWTTKRPTYSSSYPVLFVAKQRKTVGGTVTCTTPVKDDTTTIIDGGHITTGTIDTNRLNADTIKSNIVQTTELNADKITSGTIAADRIKANVISAVNNGTGTINADKINASNLTIGYSQLTNTPTIPSKVSDLTNDSGFQTASQVTEAIDNLEIGGRNLLLGTGIERSQLYSNTTVTRWAFAFSGNLPVGTYTISFYAKSSNGTDKFYASIANASSTVMRVVDENQGTPSTYKLYSSTFNYTSTATSNGFFITSCSGHGSPHNNGNNGTVYYKEVKLERGDKATDWSPAPEDVDASIPTKVSDLTNDSGFQTSSQVDTAITSKGYATTIQAQGYASTAKTEAIAAAATDATNKANAVQENLDNLEIGGRNLLLWTTDLPKGSNTSEQGKDGIAAWGNANSLLGETTDGIKLTAAGNSQECIGIPLAVDGSVQDGDNVFLTFEARGNITSVGQFYWIQETAPNIAKTSWLNGSSSITLSETEWTKFVTPINTASANVRICTRILLFYNLGSANSGKWIELRKKSVKLERGTKPTDWTPAPEDVDDAITLVNDAVNSGRNWYAESSTAAGTVAKVATISPATTEFTTDILKPGTTVYVKFSATNSGAVASLTLNVNNTGAKNIKYRVNNGTQANLPAANYIVANQLHKFTYDGTYWVMDINYYTDSTAMYTKYYNAIVAGNTITAASIIGGRTDGKFYQIKENSSFDLAHPLLWTTVAISSGGTNYNDIYTQYNNATLATYYTSFSNTTANRLVYLVGTISGNTFTTYGANSNSYLTVTPPTTADGRFYIPLGRLGNPSNGKNYFNFQVSVPVTLYAYLDGKFRQVTPTEVVGEQYIYCSAVSGTNSMSKYETWVEPPTSVTASTQNSWTTKRPEYSSSYPVLFVAKQTKRLDGTVTCTTPVKDDTTTVIDGGHITTGTIDADRISTTVINAINANVTDTINANKINASELRIGYSQVNDTPTIPTKVSDLTNDSGFQNSTQVNTAITSKGYQTSSQVETAITSKGYQTSTQVETAITSKGYATTTQAQGYADAKDDAIAAAAKRTNVSIAVTAINYDLGTATLQATLYVDGTATTSNVTYKWLKDGSVISGQTARTLSVTAAMGLSHVYSCTVTYS